MRRKQKKGKCSNQIQLGADGQGKPHSRLASPLGLSKGGDRLETYNLPAFLEHEDILLLNSQ